MAKLLSILILCLLTVGCASVMHDLNEADKNRSKYCNYDGAFNLGMEEAKKGYSMDTNLATTHCGGAAKDDATKGYRDGYMTGKSQSNSNK